MTWAHVINRLQGRIGPGTHIDPTVQVLGWRNVRFGANCVIGEHTCLNVNDRTGLRLEIGDNVFIGRRNFFSTGDQLTIGDYCLTGPNCNFLGAGHVMTDPFTPYIVAGIESYGVLAVGPNCWLTSAVTVLGGVKIGYGSIIGANSLVNRDIPPLCLAVGNPARVIKVYDLSQACWRNLPADPALAAEALEQHQRSLPVEEAYLSELRRKHPRVVVPKIAAGRAGGEI